MLFEGLLGVVDGTLQETDLRQDQERGREEETASPMTRPPTGGWAGITDKYWLTALIPDQSVPATVNFRHIAENGDHYQVDYVTQDAADDRAGRRRGAGVAPVRRRQGGAPAGSL